MRVLCVFGLVATLTVFRQPVNGWHQVADPEPLLVSTSIGSPVTLHEPVIAELLLENVSNEEIQVDLGVNRKDGLILQVNPPSGLTVQSTYKWQILERSGGIGRINIRPGQSYSQRVILNEWYDFSESGRYDLAIGVTKVTVSGKG